MSEALRQDKHIADAKLWQWREQELVPVESLEIEQHVQICTACRNRAQSLGEMLNAARAEHLAPQPTLAQQVHLLAALQSEFAPSQQVHALAEACHGLVRWLAPALAVLAAVFVLWQEETAVSNSSLEGLLSQSREEQLLMSDDAEVAQQALLEMAFATGEK